MIEHLLERWWFIALLGILVILCAPPISLALRRTRLPEAFRGASIYENYLVVRLAVDRPGLTIFGFGVLQILLACFLGLFDRSQNNSIENADRPIDGGFYILDVGEAGWIGAQEDYQQIESAERERGFKGEIIVSIEGAEIGRFDNYGGSYWLNAFLEEGGRIAVTGYSSEPIYVGLRFIKADESITSEYEWHVILHVEKIKKGEIEYQIDFEEARKMRNERSNHPFEEKGSS